MKMAVAPSSFDLAALLMRALRGPARQGRGPKRGRGGARLTSRRLRPSLPDARQALMNSVRGRILYDFSGSVCEATRCTRQVSELDFARGA